MIRGGSSEPTGEQAGTWEEIERLVRRGWVLPALAPLLLWGGLGAGKLTSRAVALPEDVPVHAFEATPAEELLLLAEHLQRVREQGERTAESLVLYRDHVEPVQASLMRRGVPAELARQVAWPLVEHSYWNGLDPATVVSVLLVESAGRPQATSFMGARGLMQVMPMHKGRWSGCGLDLYDIEDNLCYGTRILAWYLNRFGGDERRALLGYNGCVNGTNTPDCFRYPDKVRSVRHQIRAEWRSSVAPVAASP